MSSWGRRRVGVGWIGLLPCAAFAVHQLRYRLAYGSRAASELRETGHPYLHSVVPWLVALVALTTGGFLRRAAGALRDGTGPGSPRRSLLGLWAMCASALVLIFAAQETLEGSFTTGHPAGFDAVFGDGGWWAIPVAAGFGLILAVVFHGAWWVVRTLARLQRHRAPDHGDRRLLRAPQTVLAVPAPLTAGWSTRGPPG